MPHLDTDQKHHVSKDSSRNKSVILQGSSSGEALLNVAPDRNSKNMFQRT